MPKIRINLSINMLLPYIILTNRNQEHLVMSHSTLFKLYLTHWTSCDSLIAHKVRVISYENVFQHMHM